MYLYTLLASPSANNFPISIFFILNKLEKMAVATSFSCSILASLSESLSASSFLIAALIMGIIDFLLIVPRLTLLFSVFSLSGSLSSLTCLFSALLLCIVLLAASAISVICWKTAFSWDCPWDRSRDLSMNWDWDWDWDWDRSWNWDPAVLDTSENVPSLHTSYSYPLKQFASS